MNTSDVAPRLKELLGQVLGVPATTVGPGTSTDTMGSWTSLNHLMLISAVEESFGLVFSNKQISDLTSYDKLLSAITAQKSSGR